jgi:hypothetical protein
MPQDLPNLRERSACAQNLGGRRVPETVSTYGRQAGFVSGPDDDLAQAARAQRAMWCAHT